jgi:mannose-6-phosphate isomerase
VVWLGFRASVTQPALRTAALAGEVLGLLNRLVVHPGETLFVPAGTVHAVGPGLVLLEVQDPIDVTYRLYDYGRDRPLQIEAALAVADLGRFVPAEPPVSGLGEGRHVLAMAPRFVAETCRIGAGFVLRPDGERYHILVALAEGASLDGRAWPRGAAVLVPAAGRAVTLGGAAGTAIAVIQPGPGVSHCIVQN